MKLIIAYVQPERLNEIKQALYAAEVYKMSITNALGGGQQMGYHQTYRGVDVEVNLLKNEMAGPEKYAVIIADYSSWYVNTNDLSELDIVNVKQGQAVTFTADALPDVVMNGTVDRISGDPKNQINDVLYTAHILVEDHDPQIKWGMTVEVTFPIE